MYVQLALHCFTFYWGCFSAPCLIRHGPSCLVTTQDWQVWGALHVLKVRMSNLVAQNTAVLLNVVLRYKPRTFVCLEQPKGSYMYKLPPFRELVRTFSLTMILTYFGMFGMQILKPTKLCTNLPKPCLG